MPPFAPALVGALVAAAAALPSRAAPPSLNVLHIVADDMRPDWGERAQALISPFGNDSLNLTRALRAEGRIDAESR